MMTLHAALGALPGPPPDARLGLAETRLMTALFAADGATEAALGRRVAAHRPAVVATLDALTRRGLVEQAASRVWLTAGGFALRRATCAGRPPGTGPVS